MTQRELFGRIPRTALESRWVMWTVQAESLHLPWRTACIEYRTDGTPPMISEKPALLSRAGTIYRHCNASQRHLLLHPMEQSHRNNSLLPVALLRERKITATTSASALRTGCGGKSADTGETFLTVFYPGTTDPSASTPIDLRPGSTFDNAEFSPFPSLSCRACFGTDREQFGPVLFAARAHQH